MSLPAATSASASASSLAEQAGMVVAQRNHAGAGQGGDVDHRGRLEALDVGERVAEDQPAFGVGVEDLHGLARKWS